jgi:hypothetical protein
MSPAAAAPATKGNNGHFMFRNHAMLTRSVPVRNSAADQGGPAAMLDFLGVVSLSNPRPLGRTDTPAR